MPRNLITDVAGIRVGHADDAKLGSGVTSLPYHHPFMVAQRFVQLDHMTRGRAMMGRTTCIPAVRGRAGEFRPGGAGAEGASPPLNLSGTDTARARQI